MMFYFRLARDLGMTVSRLLKEANSWELAAWLEYYPAEKQFIENKQKEEQAKRSQKELKKRLMSTGIRAKQKIGKNKI